MKKKPNIIVFMTDQQNGDTITSRYPAVIPNIEKFLEDAVIMDDAYCVSPHCCPSRASFFSGLYPSQHGIWHNVNVDNAISRGLYDGIILFPEVLKASGYRTYFSGKWHVSAYEGPADRGFDEVLNDHVARYNRFAQENKKRSKDWERAYSKKERINLDGQKKAFGHIAREGYPEYYQFGTSENPHGDTDTVEKACEMIRTYNEEEPFFLYVGTIGPHDPYLPPQKFIDMYKDVEIRLPENFHDSMLDKPALYRRTRDRFDLTEEEHVESIRRYLAFVSYEDSLFGQLLDAVREKGIYEDTYIIYLTDHGDYMGAHGLWAKGLPCFREAYHICAAVGGGEIKGQRHADRLVSMVDFAPTILEMAGTGLECQGQSLLPLIKGEEPGDWRQEICTQTNGNELYGIQRAVWDKKWKYVFNGFDYDELYDLESDPLEMHNLLHDCEKGQYQDVVKEYCKKMWRFARKTKDNCTCPYIMVSLAPYGPGVLLEDEE